MPLDVIGNGSFSDSLNVTNHFAVGSSSLLVNSAGNVGIGTTAPVNALNVIGDINATGAIYKNGQTALDYVFEPDYPLMSLEDLKKFVKKNKHLPNLESEKYTGNVEIGILPSLLLEKTEEQTLYIIQLSEENKRQQKQIDELKTEVRQLKESSKTVKAQETALEARKNAEKTMEE